MHFSKIFPTKYFAVCFFEILEACCNLKQGSLVMSLPFFFWGVLDMGAEGSEGSDVKSDVLRSNLESLRASLGESMDKWMV